MPYEQVRDVLERARQFHRDLRNFFEESTVAADDPRAELLLDFMSRHEKHFDRALGEYAAAASKAILDTWIQFVPDEATRRAFEGAVIEPEMSVDQVIEIALRPDTSLVRLYELLANRLTSAEAQGLFEKLVEMQRSNEIERAKSALQTEQI